MPACMLSWCALWTNIFLKCKHWDSRSQILRLVFKEESQIISLIFNFFYSLGHQLFLKAGPWESAPGRKAEVLGSSLGSSFWLPWSLEVGLGPNQKLLKALSLLALWYCRTLRVCPCMAMYIHICATWCGVFAYSYDIALDTPEMLEFPGAILRTRLNLIHLFISQWLIQCLSSMSDRGNSSL